MGSLTQQNLWLAFPKKGKWVGKVFYTFFLQNLNLIRSCCQLKSCHLGENFFSFGVEYLHPSQSRKAKYIRSQLKNRFIYLFMFFCFSTGYLFSFFFFHYHLLAPISSSTSRKQGIFNVQNQQPTNISDTFAAKLCAGFRYMC